MNGHENRTVFYSMKNKSANDHQPLPAGAVLRHVDIAGMGFNCRLGMLSYAAAPDKPKRGLVIAVHGLTRQKRDFDDMAVFLAARGYDVWCVDAPGRGDSSWLARGEDYTLDTYSDIFAALIDQHVGGPVFWVGCSMGGLIALTMAARGQASGRMRAVMLVDITHRPNAVALERIASYIVDTNPVLPDRDGYRTLVRVNLPLGDVPEHVWRRFADCQMISVPGGWSFHYDVRAISFSRDALRQTIDLSAGVRALDVPLALAAGEISDLCTAQEIQDLKAIHSQLAVHICPKAGHIPALHDSASNGFIADFFDLVT